MSRATIFQAAIAVIVFGISLMLVGSTPVNTHPAATQSWRPATDAERQQHDRLQLEEEMDRLWEQRPGR